MDWKPIETAPKDGRDVPFLAFHSGGYWSLSYWSDKYEKIVCYWDGDPPADEHAATHWMPLPAPPK